MVVVAIIAAGILVASLVQKGAETASKSRKNFDVVGTLVLTDNSDDFSSGAMCNGSDGYSDIRNGAQVTIKTSAGKVVAVGALEAGTSFGSNQCSFAFLISDVPDGGGNIYSVEVAHRGEINFNRSEADAVSLTLGDDS